MTKSATATLVVGLAAAALLVACNTFRDTGEPPDEDVLADLLDTREDTGADADTTPLPDVPDGDDVPDTAELPDTTPDGESDLDAQVDATDADTGDTDAGDTDASDADADMGGVCDDASCGPGQGCCESSGVPRCYDFQSDPQHCGGCNLPCEPTTHDCVAGACLPDCRAGELRCDGACTDVLSNDLHCGSCDNACAADLTCSSGTCSCGDAGECPAGWSCCSGGCVDPSSDTSHCGGCGVVCDGVEDCVASACTLGTWYFVGTSVLSMSMATSRGTAVFDATGRATLDSQDANAGTSVSTTPMPISISAGSVTLPTNLLTYYGRITPAHDFMVFSPKSTQIGPTQSIWVRKGSGHSTASLDGSWYVGSFLDDSFGAGAPRPYSVYGTVEFAAGTMTVSLSDSLGGTDTMTMGTASVTPDGAVVISRSDEWIWAGQLSRDGNLMALTADNDNNPTNGYQPGHLVLVRHSSGMSVDAVSGTYELNHITATLGVWGSVTASSATFTGGTFSATNGQTYNVCASGSAVTNQPTGQVSATLVHGINTACDLTGQNAGWAAPSSGRSEILVLRNNLPTVASLQVWLRAP